MPRLMSVALTEPSVRDRTKTVTRRLGWLMLKPADRLTLVRKAMGRRRPDGTVEPLVRIVDVSVVSTRRERLDEITDAEVVLEGLAPMTAAEFVPFFIASHKGCRPDSMVTRVEWVYL